MAGCGDRFAFGDGLAAVLADFIAGVAVCHTGSFKSTYQLSIVAGCGDHFVVADLFTAVFTVLLAGVAVFRTSRRFGTNGFDVFVHTGAGHNKQTGEQIGVVFVRPGFVAKIFVHFANIVHNSKCTAGGRVANDLVIAAVLRKQHEHITGHGVIVHGHGVAIGVAVDALILQSGGLLDSAFLQIQNEDIVIVAGIAVDHTIGIRGQRINVGMVIAEAVQFRQRAVFQINFIDSTAARIFGVPLIGGVIIGVQIEEVCRIASDGQHPIFSAIPSQIANFKIRRDGLYDTGIFLDISFVDFHTRITQILTLKGFEVFDHKELVLGVITVDLAANHCHGTDSCIRLRLGQVRDLSGIGSVDHCKAGIRPVVSQQIVTVVIDNHGAGGGVNIAFLILDSNNDRRSAGTHSGHNAAAIHGGNRLIGGAPFQFGNAAVRTEECRQLDRAADFQFFLLRNQGHADHIVGDLGIRIRQDVHTGQGGTGIADLAQFIDRFRFQINQVQTVDGDGIKIAGLEHRRPVDIAGVIVIGHGSQLVALDAKVKDHLVGAVFHIQLIEHGVGIDIGPAPGIIFHIAGGDGVQSAVRGCGQAHEEGLGCHARDQNAGRHVDHIQIGGAVVRAGHGKHGAGGVVEGHVIDERECIAHVDRGFDLIGRCVDDHELEGRFPIRGIVAVSIELAVHIFLGIEQITAGVEVNDAVGGILVVKLGPDFAAAGVDVRDNETVDVAGGILDEYGEGELIGFALVEQDAVHGGAAFRDTDDHAVFNLGDGLIGGSQSVILVGCVQRLDGQSRELASVNHQQHIFCGNTGDRDIRQLIDFFGNGIKAHKLEQAGAGGITQSQSIGLVGKDVDPEQVDSLRVGPQQHAVVVVEAHGLPVVQGAQTFHDVNRFKHHGHIAVRQRCGLAGRQRQPAAAHIGLIQEQVVQNALGGDGIQAALGIAGQSQIEVINLSDIDQSAGVHVDILQRGAVVALVHSDCIHVAGGVVVSHIGGNEGDGAAQSNTLTGFRVEAVELAVDIIAVDVAVMAVVVGSHEVHGRIIQARVAHLGQIDRDPVFIVAGVVEVVVGIQGAFHIDHIDHAGCGNTFAGGGDDGSALGERGDHTVGHRSNGGIAGSPDNILCRLIVPRQDGGGQLRGFADAEVQALGAEQDRGNCFALRQGVVIFVQRQQADTLGVHGEFHGRHGGILAADIDGEQLGIAGVGEECIVDALVSGAVGHGLGVVRSCIAAVGAGQLDRVAVGIGNRFQFPGFLIDLVQTVVVILDGVDLAVVGGGHGVGQRVSAGGLSQSGQLAGQEIQGGQGVNSAVAVFGQSPGGDIHGVIGLVEGHVQNVDAQVADGLAEEQTRLHNEEVVAGIDREDVAVDILRRVDGVVLVHVVGQLGGLGSFLVDGDPAVQRVVPDRGVIHAVGVQRIGIDFRLVAVSGQLTAFKLDRVVGFVGAVVTQSQRELRAEIGDIQNHGIRAVGHLRKFVAVGQDGGAGRRQQGCVSGRGFVRETQGHQQSAVVRGGRDGASFHQLGGIPVKRQRDGDGLLLIGAFGLERSGDDQIDLGAARQRIAVDIGEVVHLAEPPGVDVRNDGTVVGQVHGLPCILSVLPVDFFAIDLIGEVQVGRVAHQGQVDLRQVVQITVAVVGDDVVGGIIGNVAVVVQSGAHIRVDTQNPAGAAQIGPEDIIVFVAFRQTVGRSHAPEAVVIPVSGIERGGLGPVAVEAKVRDAQVYAVRIGQVDKAFHIAAVGIVGVEEALAIGVQGDRNGNVCGAVGRHGDRVLAEGHAAAEGGVVTDHELLHAVVDDVFRQQARGELVGFIFAAEVMNGKGEGEGAVGAGTQLGLGLVIFLAGHRHIGFGGHSIVSVDQTGALLAGRGFNFGLDVHNGLRSAHEKRVGHFTKLSGVGDADHFLQVFLDQSSHTGNLRGRHGSTGHQTVGTAVIAGIHTAADAGHIGSQAQSGVGTPGAEGAHLTAGFVNHGLHLIVNGEDLGLLSGHVFAAIQADQHAGNIAGDAVHQVAVVVGHRHAEIGDGAGDIVGDNNTNGAVGFGVGQLQSEVDGAAGDDCDLTGHIQTLEVRCFAQTGNHDIFQFLTGQRVEGDVQAIGFAVHVVHAAHGKDRRNDLRVIHGGDGVYVDVSRGRTNRRVIGVAGGVHVGAPQVAIGAGAVVAGGDVDNRCGVGNTGIDTVDEFLGRGCKAGGAAQRQVNHISTQGQRIFQSGDDIVGISTAVGAEDLHDKQLRVGSHTHNAGTVDCIGGSNTGNMSAVVAHGVGGVVSDQVGVHIVERVGDLLAAIQIGSRDVVHVVLVGVQVFQNRSNAVGCHGSVRRISGKRGVIQIKAGINDGDGHAGTGQAQFLPHGGNAGHTTGRDGVRLIGRAGHHKGVVGHGVIHGHQEHALDAGDLRNGLEVAELRGDGEGVGQVGKLTVYLQRCAAEHIFLNGGDDTTLLPLQSSLALRGNRVDVAVLIDQRFLLQNDEGGDDFAGGVGLGCFAQLSHRGRQLSGQIKTGGLLSERGGPCRVCGDRTCRSGVVGLRREGVFTALNRRSAFDRNTGKIVPQGGEASCSVFGSNDFRFLCGGSFCCFQLKLGDLSSAVRVSAGGCSGDRRDAAEEHAEHKHQCQQSFCFHSFSSYWFFVTKTQMRYRYMVWAKSSAAILRHV